MPFLPLNVPPPAARHPARTGFLGLRGHLRGRRPMNRITIAGLALVVVLAIVASASLFTVTQTEQVLVVQFGKVVRPIEDPGCTSRWPIAQNIISFDKRLLAVELPGEEVILGDQRRLIIDTLHRFPHHRSATLLPGHRADPGEHSRPAELRRHRQPAARAGQQQAAGRAVGRSRADHVRDPRTGEHRDAEFRRLHRGRPDPARRPAAGKHPGDPVADAVGTATRRRSGSCRGGGSARRIGRGRTGTHRAAGGRQGDRRKNRGEGEGEATSIFAKSFGQDPAFFSIWRTLQGYRDVFDSGNARLV